MSRYIALVDGKAGAYGVVVPDLPGCTSAGKTTDEALRNAVGAVRLWVWNMPAPMASVCPSQAPLEALRKDFDFRAALRDGAALAVVPLLLDAGRPANSQSVAGRRPLAGHRCRR